MQGIYRKIQSSEYTGVSAAKISKKEYGHMAGTIHTVKRYISSREVTREELLSRKIKSPALDTLYQTVLKRMEGKNMSLLEK